MAAFFELDGVSFSYGINERDEKGNVIESAKLKNETATRKIKFELETTEGTGLGQRSTKETTAKGWAAKDPKGLAAKDPKGWAAKYPKGWAAKDPKGLAAKDPKGLAAKDPKGLAAEDKKAWAACSGQFSGEAWVTASAKEDDEVKRWHISFIQNINHLERIGHYSNGLRIVESFQAPMPLRDEDGESFLAELHREKKALEKGPEAETHPQILKSRMVPGKENDPKVIDEPPSVWPDSLAETRWDAIAATNAQLERICGSAKFTAWLVLARTAKENLKQLQQAQPKDRAAVVLLGKASWQAEYDTTINRNATEQPAPPPVTWTENSEHKDFIAKPTVYYTNSSLKELGEGNYPDLRWKTRTESMFHRALDANDNEIGKWSVGDNEQTPKKVLDIWNAPSDDSSFLPED